MTSAAGLIRERNVEVLGDRYDLAERFGAVEWCAAILDEKKFLVVLLRELAREQRAADPDAAETIGRLRAALDLLHGDTVDLGSLEAIIGGAIRELGGRP